MVLRLSQKFTLPDQSRQSLHEFGWQIYALEVSYRCLLGRKRAARDHRSVYYCRAVGEVKNYAERRQRAPGRSAIIVNRLG